MLAAGRPGPYLLGGGASPGTGLFDEAFQLFVGRHAPGMVVPYDMRHFLATVYCKLTGPCPRLLALGGWQTEATLR